MKILPLLLIVTVGISVAVIAQERSALGTGLRGPAALDIEPRPAPIPRMVNDDQRRARGWPTQPPVIPHQIENYQVDRQFNKCMSCHGRDRVSESQAPMVSVTHYTDRAGNTLGEVSPRRYFCTQCHVPQMDVKPPVANTFQDVSSVEARAQKGKKP